mmetsp:Transcript_15195/g.47427  ORF Transcript_15195/g.47427 Transcript_15195/m.47427 type:complete len:217 (+) Transcript_15195:1299-1949(+)
MVGGEEEEEVCECGVAGGVSWSNEVSSEGRCRGSVSGGSDSASRPLPLVEVPPAGATVVLAWPGPSASRSVVLSRSRLGVSRRDVDSLRGVSLREGSLLGVRKGDQVPESGSRRGGGDWATRGVVASQSRSSRSRSLPPPLRLTDNPRRSRSTSPPPLLPRLILRRTTTSPPLAVLFVPFPDRVPFPFPAPFPFGFLASVPISFPFPDFPLSLSLQ